MNKCMGCGAILQTKDKNSLGFIPKEKYKEGKLCERCFRILHYNDLKVVDLPAKDIIEIVNQSKTYAFFLVDLLNINSEVIENYKKIKIPKSLIVSKIDFIPKYINKEHIKDWLKEEYGIEENIIFLSAVKNVNIGKIVQTLKNENKKTGYLLGFTNSGKSTLVNKLKENNLVTTSVVPNTTVDFIEIQLEEGIRLIDTPGLQYQETIYKKDDIFFIKKINPKSFLKPMTFQLKKGASIIIEDVLRLENKSDKCNLTIYMSNLLDFKKVYEKNSFLKNGKCKNLQMQRNEDIVIKGLGFINIKSNAEVSLYMENLDLVETRKSFFERW